MNKLTSILKHTSRHLQKQIRLIYGTPARSSLSHRFFSTEVPSVETESTSEKPIFEEPEITKGPSEKFAFQTETAKLLHIVAKSLYTDKDVFIRELLSNASDAIEKIRYYILSGNSNSATPLQISIICNEDKRQLIIQDTGIGMNKEDLIAHLGTIASSGSRKFLEKLKENQSNAKDLEENLIGQFGVGFYSSFIVADTVEVVSKKEGEEAYAWTSDGSGTFDLAKAENFHLEHGTRIVLHLRPEFVNYTRGDEIKKVIEKYSNFINHPIFVNHEKINLVAALWSRDKRECSEEEYRTFYEHLTKSKQLYRYKLHYQTDVPMVIKTLLYIPMQNSEMFGFSTAEVGVDLYSKKVLIKPSCRELIPNYLRFVKGIVDCEDIPLNISRENYQDSNLVHKLRSVVTKRILRLLESESKNHPEEYLKWYKDFHIYLKEGLHSDTENSEILLGLSRYDSSFADQITIDNYIEKMKPNQKNIYYYLAPQKDMALHSPYMEPFIKNDVPVLYISVNIEEMIFRQLTEYKKFTFVNVESAEADLPKDLLKEDKEISLNKENLPEEDLQIFSLWVKNELQPVVVNVLSSKRLTDSPAIVVSNVSTGMRQIMSMMDQANAGEMGKNLTFEYNPTHPIIINLNKLRKNNIKAANFNLKQLLDSCLMSANIPFDQKNFVRRINEYILLNLKSNLGNQGLVEGGQSASVEENTGMGVLNEALKHSKRFSEEKKSEDFEFEVNEKGEPVIKENK